MPEETIRFAAPPRQGPVLTDVGRGGSEAGQGGETSGTPCGIGRGGTTVLAAREDRKPGLTCWNRVARHRVPSHAAAVSRLRRAGARAALRRCRASRFDSRVCRPDPHARERRTIGVTRRPSARLRSPARYTSWPTACAKVAELADALALGASGATRGGSNPPFRTIALRVRGVSADATPPASPRFRFPRRQSQRSHAAAHDRDG